MKVDPNQLRKRFLDFFDARMKDHAKAKGHGVKPGVSLALPSSSLQPPDASTLFTSAGMHQFKDDFTGNLVHGTRAAATVQKCMRTPDLENVGKTARHHTFFEMLGFFSFGDGLSGPNGSVGFFKKEAIRWIWDFYTLPWDQGGCGLDTGKLYVSVYKGDENGKDRDTEAIELWTAILQPLHPGVSLLGKRIFELGEHDNFWPAGAPSQGPNGVCGPCSEIFYDLGDEYGQGDVASNGNRFMEIGNIVFTQYERSGPTPGKGTLTPLPAKNIDFGGGFERLVMVLDGAKTTLDSGLFTAVRKALSVHAATSPRDPAPSAGAHGENLVREKRIADHIRAATFAMADGILPSNEGAGYVIRRIIRRAFRDGSALGFDGPFLHKLVPVIVEGYGEAYPELKRNTSAIAATIQQEEQQFSTTLERGLQLLAGLIREHKKRDDKTLDGKAAFDLYQSQGLPREVVQDEAAAEGMLLDQLGYDAAEEAHRQASKGGKQVVVFEKGWFQDLKAKAKPTEFLGYETCDSTARVIALVRDGQNFDIVEQGDSVIVVLDRTPFYAESGGQVGDRGSLHVDAGLFEVIDTKKRDDYWLHEGKLKHGKLRVGDTVEALVDQTRRDSIRRNHSATHLMHAALRKVLGEHVVQRGSEVRPDGLRFDFSHPKAVTFEERQQIETLVNEQIRVNAQVGTAIMSPEEAQKAGAMALFGEKYGDKVRVLTMGSGTGVPPVKKVERGVSPLSSATFRFRPGTGEVRRRQGANLPHWEQSGATYFVTFRLADALPAAVIEQIRAERDDIVNTAARLGRDLSDDELHRLQELQTVKMDQFLNAGHGACWLRRDDCAKVLADALNHFDRERYDLAAWCVMPNHVHVLVRPLFAHTLQEILHSWKSFTAKKCLELVGRTGAFWQEEYFDRIVRDEAEFERFVGYIAANPVDAGLKDWAWVNTPATGEDARETFNTGETPVPQAFSMELCGGTHVSRTGDIGFFRITSEGSSSAGVRRIEAVTGADAVEIAAAEARLLAQLHAVTKAQPGKVLEKVEGLIKEVKDLKGKARQGGGVGGNVLETIRKESETVGDASLYVGDAGAAEATDLLTIKESLGQDAKSFAILLGSRGEDRVSLLLAFSKDLVGRGLHAGKIVGEIARLVDGKGGGKPEVAQAGGKKPEALAEALAQGRNRLREMLKN
ncbi:MAG: alanine--tRNA ligase [Planctomycetes bacterium]|nr:alanine--tRNA ligase [Planctomycetota bacterium]